MCEAPSVHDLTERVASLVESGANNGAVLSELELVGYVIVRDSVLGVGASFSAGDEQIICYHPALTSSSIETADP